MPQPGHFILHSSAIPDLPAGAYTAEVSQTLDAPGAAVAPRAAHLEVTAPRFALGADQLLSTFPPNQSQGDFSSRLPQVVLRRRTLPWERAIGGPPGTPWLALVVLADAEAELKASLPVAQCVTPGVSIAGRSDVAVGDAIVVTDRVVAQVFPTQAELPYLTHVREVDLDDTELALGDDDGWLAVVLANRLPQPGVRYRACLISLEGQLGVLPQPGDVRDEFDSTFVYADAAAHADLLTAVYTAAPDAAPALPAHVVIEAAAAGTLPLAAGAPARASTIADAWSSAGVAAGAAAFAPAARTATHVADLHGIGMGYIDPGATLRTFPLLAHWTFTCTGAGDFESRMRAIDVGMLGTAPAAPPVPAAGEKPPPPAAPPPELLDTGHLALASTSRGGEPGTIWYRGPLVPRPVTRTAPDADGLLALLHTSDQARRVGPDGRENLALAIAFEIGRLLALAEPSVVAALLTWRKDGYDAARRGRLLARDPRLATIAGVKVAAGFAARAGNALVTRLGERRAALLGPPRPSVDPGNPIAAIDEADPLGTLAAGLALAPELLKELGDPGAVRAAGGVELPTPDRVTGLDELARSAGRELAALRAVADRQAAELAVQATKAPTPGVGRAAGRPDALDALIGRLEERDA